MTNLEISALAKEIIEALADKSGDPLVNMETVLADILIEYMDLAYEDGYNKAKREVD